MSHYSVAVFHREDQNIEDLLAPYDENTQVAPYVEYTREQAIEYARKTFEEATKDMSDDECWNFMAEDFKDEPWQIDEKGNLYSRYNPKSKWDWWCVGGRFHGILIDKIDGYDVDFGKVSEVEFPFSQRRYEVALKNWDKWIDETEPTTEDEKCPWFYNKEYMKKRYKDRETYALCAATTSTYAVVTPDGEWHEPGSMGWWGVSHAEPSEALEFELHYKERFLDTADPEWFVTIIDCHI